MPVITRSSAFCAYPFYVLLSIILPLQANSSEFRVLLALSNNSPPYQAFSNTFKNSLPSSILTSIVDAPEQLASHHDAADLIVAVGMKAAEVAALQTTIPVLVVMTPQSSYEGLIGSPTVQKIPRRIAAIYLNQPWDRQIDFLFAVLPTRHKIGVLYTPAIKKEVERLHEEIVKHAGSLMVQPVYSDATLFDDLEKILQTSDVLLAVPDSTIYSSSNVRNILLSTYRQNVPLIGISQGYVNAGAIAALFSTPEQLAEQSASTAIAYAQSGRWPASQYPKTFTIAFNQQVAHSLGIELDSEEVIRVRMGKTGKGAHD